MGKTNRFIYAYKIKWGNGLNLDYLKTNFIENNKWNNFILKLLCQKPKCYDDSLVYQ